MSDPLDKAAAHAPPTLGEGCLSRYDPDALSAEDGTEFPGAAELWQALAVQGKAPGDDSSSPAAPDGESL